MATNCWILLSGEYLYGIVSTRMNSHLIPQIARWFYAPLLNLTATRDSSKLFSNASIERPHWRCDSFTGAFLIPFMIMLVLEGIPLFLIELGMGQRMRLGALGVWNTIHPWLGGIGISSCIVTLFVSLYYNVIITWCFYYFFNSFQVISRNLQEGQNINTRFDSRARCRGRRVPKLTAPMFQNVPALRRRPTSGIGPLWTRHRRSMIPGV